ncbi:hypothetical protein KSP35_22125 [Aquihabitans sp. G128]|uniref:hypothetical protein n=1 Tax=Aquihabitans sp. G128 TaxID=2849779 RepID=UPI001C225C8F|nr:hypothetical protein [Aquihabitans sp. G128]QXC60977.1 hypothetical protein KSP35_22125 [Aquihabitans sp. G128]
MGLWDLHQEMNIRALQSDQMLAETAADGRFDSARDQAYRLEDRLERLLLLTDALWELASEKLGVTEEQLAAKVTEIDARDGSIDGRRTRPATTCPQCSSAVPKGRATCMFCGAAQPAPPPFDTV